MVNRFTGSGRQKEGGFLGTHKQDFNAHVTGGDWRHTSDQLDLSSPIEGIIGTTVQDALEILATTKAYYEIGDGYDSCTGNLADAFQTAFNSPQLTNGGTIFLKSGSYCITSTVIVPPGISIIGESAGSTFINAKMSETPVFQIQTGTVKKDTAVNGSNVSTAKMLQFADQNFLASFTIYDNSDGSVASGGPSMGSVPFIQYKHGANLVVSGCVLSGRSKLGVNQSFAGLAMTGTTTAGVGTTVAVHNCYIDGVKFGIDSDTRQGSLDYLVIDGCRIKTPFFTGYPGVCLTAVACNIIATNNIYYNGSSTSSFLQIKNIVPSGSSSYEFVLDGNSGTGPTINGTFIDDLRATKSYIRTTGVNSWGGIFDISPSYAEDISSGILQNEVTSSGAPYTNTRGLITHSFSHRVLNTNISTDTSYWLNPRNSAGTFGTSGSGFGCVNVMVDAALSAPVTITVNDAPGDVSNGTFFEFIVTNKFGANITMTWDAKYKFSNVNDAQIGVDNGKPNIVTRWKCLAFLDQISGTQVYLVERIDYKF